MAITKTEEAKAKELREKLRVVATKENLPYGMVLWALKGLVVEYEQRGESFLGETTIDQVAKSPRSYGNMSLYGTND